ncbi:MAG: hypothetical protein NT013_21015 [Planctomycetia bacterium]|nr:hypothetical protein [Planctomycetia bacterium]
MKKNRNCLKCESQEVIHLPSVTDAAPGTAIGGITEMALQRGWFHHAGYLEAYVCNACGYVEFYVKDLQELRQLSGRVMHRDDLGMSSWELQLLAKRVSTIEHLAAPDGPTRSTAQSLLDLTGITPIQFLNQTVDSLQQFLVLTCNDDQKTFATRLLETVKSYQDRIEYL